MDTAAITYGQGRLMSLVDELLLCIIEKVEAQQDLVHFAVTCTRLQGLVEPFIWQSICVRRGLHAQQLHEAFEYRKQRVSSIQNLSIRYRHSNEDGIQALDEWIHDMDHLRHLTIESPCPNNDPWRNGRSEFHSWTRIDYGRLFTAAINPQSPRLVLPLLQSLTLHGHGPKDRRFVFGRNAVIFLHPTLRDVTISCTNFDADIDPSLIQSKRKTTPLQSLKLIECNIYISLLDVVLSLPKALKELSLSERLYVFNGCVPSHGMNAKPRTTHPSFLDVLQHQADSLERLVHIAGTVRYCVPMMTAASGIDKLRSLSNLKHLELGLESPLNVYMHHGGCPPSLQSLRLSNAAFSQLAPDFINQTINHMLDQCRRYVLHSVHQPIDLDVLFCHSAMAPYIPVDDLQRFWGAAALSDNRMKVYEVALPLLSRGSRFRIFGQAFVGSNSYVPPYMEGEEQPHEVLLYDSARPFHFQGRDFRWHDDAVYEALPCNACKEAGLECQNALKSRCEQCVAGNKECVFVVQYNADAFKGELEGTQN